MERIVGSFSLRIDPEHLMEKEKRTSWLGLIGMTLEWKKIFPHSNPEKHACFFLLKDFL